MNSVGGGPLTPGGSGTRSWCAPRRCRVAVARRRVDRRASRPARRARSCPDDCRPAPASPGGAPSPSQPGGPTSAAAELASAPAGRDAGLPEHLVHAQVAVAGHHRLVEQHRLHRLPAAGESRPPARSAPIDRKSGPSRDRGRGRPRTPPTVGVVHAQDPPASKCDDEPVPRRRRRDRCRTPVARSAPHHRRSGVRSSRSAGRARQLAVGCQVHENLLADPAGADDATAGEQRAQLLGRNLSIVDVDDSHRSAGAPQRRTPVDLGLQALWHDTPPIRSRHRRRGTSRSARPPGRSG